MDRRQKADQSLGGAVIVRGGKEHLLGSYTFASDFLDLFFDKVK